MNREAKLLFLFYLAIIGIPAYLVRFSFFGIPTNLFELLALLACLVWFFQKKNTVFTEFHNFPKSLKIGLFLLLVGLLFSIIEGGVYLASLGILKGWFLIPSFFAYAFITLHKTTADIQRSLWVIYASSLLVALISAFYKFFNLTTYDHRLAGIYASPNYLAMYLAPGFLLGLYFLIKAVYEKKSALLSFVLALSVFTLGFCLFATFSYTTWLGIFGSILLTFLILKPTKKNWLVFLFLSLLAIFLILNNSSLRATTQNYFDVNSRSSFASRSIIWKASFKMLKEKPFRGIGPGNFQANYLALQPLFPPFLEWAVPHPHNTFLAFWLQAGLLGLAGFLILLFLSVKTAFVLLKKNKGLTPALPLFAFFAYFIFASLADTLYWKNDLAVVFWLLFFFTYRLGTIQKN